MTPVTPAFTAVTATAGLTLAAVAVWVAARPNTPPTKEAHRG